MRRHELVRRRLPSPPRDAVCTHGQLSGELAGSWQRRVIARKRICRFQMARYACGVLGNKSHADAAAEMEFELEGCRLLRLRQNVARFAKVMDGRKLLLLGDSVTRQSFIELLCALSSSDNSSSEVTHDDPEWVPFTHPAICGAARCSHVPGEKALIANDHCYRFWMGAANFSICHEYVLQDIDGALRGATRKYHLTHHDVVLANVGAHSDDTFTERLTEFASTLNRSLAFDTRPLVIYRQPAPFHTLLGASPVGVGTDTGTNADDNGTKKEGVRTELNHRVGLPQLPCHPAVQPWFDSSSIRRSLALMVEVGVPTLQVEIRGHRPSAVRRRSLLAAITICSRRSVCSLPCSRAPSSPS